MLGLSASRGCPHSFAQVTHAPSSKPAMVYRFLLISLHSKLLLCHFQEILWLHWAYVNNPQLPWWLSGKNSPPNARDTGLIPGSGRSPAEGNGNPVQCSCLENPMDSGTWRATADGIAKVRYDLATNQQKSNYVWACLCFLAQDFLVPSCTFLAVAPKSVISQRKISLFVGILH